MGEEARKIQLKEGKRKMAEQGEVGSATEWKEGDYCVATYSVDSAPYEGKIVSVNLDERGHRYALVRFLG